jgi:hypothetical protein
MRQTRVQKLPVIPALIGLRQKDLKFKASVIFVEVQVSLDYIVRP